MASVQKQWDDRHFSEAVMQALGTLADIIHKFGEVHICTFLFEECIQHCTALWGKEDDS